MAVRCKFLVVMVVVGCGGAPVPRTSGPSRAPDPPVTVVAPAPPAVPPPRADGRLPAGVKPTRYALDLVVDPSRATFAGRVRIGVTIDQPTRAIVMHGRGLTVREAALVSRGTRLVARAALRMAAGSKGEPEELVLTFAEPAKVGEAEIDLSYEAPFGDGLRGLYRVKEGGAMFAYTQFEPNNARRAFPGFDEPAHKTPFELSLTVPKGSVAFANTKEASQRESANGDQITFAFETSPPLPTYLVAFGVGPLEVLEGPRQPTSVRLIAVNGKTALGKMSVDAAAAQLDLLGKYFDRPYPYSKLDIVAVPNFGAGAMENPGFVTFREELLLLDPQRASTGARRAMAAVMAHELAHQWFGDLVTMVWWDDLWLNEAFASWMSDKIVDQWRPQTRARVYAVGSKAHVMAEDALASVRMIRNPVRSTGEAEEAFDAITYGKGRAVLSMTEAWLGEEAFRDGLRRYIKKHEWGNATAADLYAALAEASGGQPVAKVMDSFTGQTGAPLVTASLACAAKDSDAGGRAVIHLRQREYQTLDRKGPTDKLWRFPVCIVYDAGAKLEKRCTLLETAEADVLLPTTRCPSFFYANAGESGYYRVNLPPAELTKLTGPPLTKLSEEERFGVVSNAWAAVWSGELPVTTFLTLLRGFRNETSKLVWGQIIDALTELDRAIVSDAARPAFAKLVRELLGPTARRLGWNPKRRASGAQPESDDQKLLREVVLGALGGLGADEWALKEARRAAEAWLSDPMATEADLARIALPLAAKRGDAALFDRIQGVFVAAKTPEIRMLALSGLTGFEDPALVDRTLALSLDGTFKVQDFRHVFFPLGTRRPTREITYAWIQRHFDQLARVVPPFVRRRLIAIAGAMCDRARVQAVETFLGPRIAHLEGAARNMRQSIEAGLRCATLAEKEIPPTSRWLASQASLKCCDDRP